MPELFAALTARYLEEHRGSASAGASDAALQWMELQLAGTREQTGQDMERYLLESYLALENDELQGLPAAVHDWFLERWAMAGPGGDDPQRLGQLAGRIADLYMAAGAGVHQVSAIAALLAFDRVSGGRPSYTLLLWDRLAANRSDEARRVLLETVVETLLDFVFLAEEPDAPLRALRDIVQRPAAREYARPILRQRIEVVGERAGAPIAGLLASFGL